MLELGAMPQIVESYSIIGIQTNLPLDFGCCDWQPSSIMFRGFPRLGVDALIAVPVEVFHLAVGV